MRMLRNAALLLALAAPAGAGEVVRDLAAPSAALGRDLGYALYRPDGARHALPAVYLLHGRDGGPADWLDMAHAARTADRLIAEGRIPPMLIVMPAAGNSWYAGPMAAAIAHDLPARIEARHGARPARAARALAGNSMGGFAALGIALAHPDRFAAAAAMSGAFWASLDTDVPLDDARRARVARVFQGAFGTPFDRPAFRRHSPSALARDFPDGAPKPAIYLVSGAEDRFGLAGQARDLFGVLTATGFDAAFETIPGDHDWGTWERALPMALEFIARRWAR